MPKRFKHVEVLDVELGDFHNMVYFATQMHVSVKRKSTIVYRSFEHFREERNTIHVCEIFDPAEESY